VRARRGVSWRGARTRSETRRRRHLGATTGESPDASQVRRFRAPSFEARLDASNERTLETRRVFRWLGFFLLLKAFSGGENFFFASEEKSERSVFSARFLCQLDNTRRTNTTTHPS
jgi:hypothetical protein